MLSNFVIAASAWLRNLLKNVSTFGLNNGGAKFLNSQGARFLKSHVGNVCNFSTVVVTVFMALPMGMIGLLQLEDSDDDLRLMDVPGTVTSGSLNIIAVAGIVLLTMKPELAPSLELNTAMTTDPGNPVANSETSVATVWL